MNGFSFWYSRYPEVLLVVGMFGAIGGLLLFAAVEWLAKRHKAREQRKLDEATDHLIRVGFLENERQKSK